MTKPTGNPRGRPRKDAIRADASDVTRADGGYANVFLNVGNARDRTAYNTPVITAPMMQQQLEALYEGNGFARRIVDLPADEMTRAGYEIEGIDDQVTEDVEGILEGIGTMEAISTACRWAGLYGGALVVMLVDDGAQDLREPLNIEKAKKSGNVLTQTLDEQGNLVGVKETVNFEERDVEESEATQLRNELLLKTAAVLEEESKVEELDE